MQHFRLRPKRLRLRPLRRKQHLTARPTTSISFRPKNASNTKSIDLNLKNSTKGEISDIVKNANLAEKRAARQEGRTPETAVNVDPTNKRAVRKMLQKDLYLDPHPRFYE